jgi:hypothetical protein
MYVIEGNYVYNEYDVITDSQIAKIKELHDYLYHIEASNGVGVCSGVIKDYEGKSYAYNGPVEVQINGGDIFLYDVVNGLFNVPIVNNTDEKKLVVFAIENMRGCELFV